MIGTTFKLGFDGTSVSRGLGNLTRGIGKGLGRIGIGAMERVGHKMTDLLGRMAMAIPDAIKETADWAGSLTDMSTATGMSISDLVVLEEKFRMAGVSAKESGAVVSRFAMNLKQAATEGGPAVDALRKLGFDGQFIVGKDIGEAFDILAQRLAIVAPTLDNVEGIMADLFGAKLGYQQLKLFQDYAAVTKQAENNVKGLKKAMGDDGGAARLDQWGDALGRFENFKRGLVSIGMEEFFNFSGGPGGPDAFFDKFDPEKLRPKIQEISRLIRNTFTYFREGDGLSGIISDIGKQLGKSIADGLKESFSGGFGLKDLIFPGKKSDPSTTQNNITPELQKHTTLLTQIRDESGVSRFA
ncbi:MAG: hypothetical protein ACK528_01680 [Alphaproteobacteria bacterium]|jgi:hypothetical protein